MIRGDIVEDDSGAYAVFIEQGSFASQMARAEVQVKMEDAPRLLKILESEWYFSKDIYMGIHEQDCYGKDNSRKFFWNLDGIKYQIADVCLFIKNKDYSCRFTWMT